MFKQYFMSDSTSVDLKVEFCGHEKCANGHFWGPYVRDSYLLHFCLNGKGVLQDKYGEHNISSGEFFAIRPDEVTTYRADDVDPWEYVWVAFSGNDASFFNSNESVYPFDKEIGLELLNLVNDKILSPTAYKAIIYKLIYALSNQKSETVTVATKIKRYIKFNYMQDIYVEQLSHLFGFEKSYLFKLFKKNVGVGIKEYLTRIRLEKAKEFLEKGFFVNETAFLVGYKDTFNFSKAFKKRFGVPPVSVKKKS